MLALLQNACKFLLETIELPFRNDDVLREGRYKNVKILLVTPKGVLADSRVAGSILSDTQPEAHGSTSSTSCSCAYNSPIRQALSMKAFRRRAGVVPGKTVVPLIGGL